MAGVAARRLAGARAADPTPSARTAASRHAPDAAHPRPRRRRAPAVPSRTRPRAAARAAPAPSPRRTPRGRRTRASRTRTRSGRGRRPGTGPSSSPSSSASCCRSTGPCPHGPVLNTVQPRKSKRHRRLERRREPRQIVATQHARVRRARGVHRRNADRGHHRLGHEPAVEGIAGGVDPRLARRAARPREPLVGVSQQRVVQPRADRGHRAPERTRTSSRTARAPRSPARSRA